MMTFTAAGTCPDRCTVSRPHNHPALAWCVVGYPCGCRAMLTFPGPGFVIVDTYRDLCAKARRLAGFAEQGRDHADMTPARYDRRWNTYRRHFGVELAPCTCDD